MQDTVRGQDRQGPLCIGTRWVIRNEAYSLPVMPFQSDICKAAPQREDTFSTSLPGRKQQLPRASPHGAHEWLQECPHLVVRTWMCKGVKALLPQQQHCRFRLPDWLLIGHSDTLVSYLDQISLTSVLSRLLASGGSLPFFLFLSMASH